jgi:hypothetical protein
MRLQSKATFFFATLPITFATHTLAVAAQIGFATALPQAKATPKQLLVDTRQPGTHAGRCAADRRRCTARLMQGCQGLPAVTASSRSKALALRHQAVDVCALATPSRLTVNPAHGGRAASRTAVGPASRPDPVF